jgi:hypothetical protein
MTGNNRDRLRRLASFFEAEVSRSRAEQMAAAAMLRARPVAQKRWALVAVPSAAALIAGLIGVGAVSDDAVPGQVLYPLDRAYESVAAFVGVDTGPGEERLVEALALIDQGRDLDAVRLVDEALSVMGRETGVTDWEPPAEVPVQPPTTAPPAADTPPTTAPAAMTPTIDPGPTIVAIEAPDASHSLRLATEYLLQTVRDAKKPKDPLQAEDAAVTLRAAASGAAAAAESVKSVAAQAVAAEDGSTTTTTVPGGSTTTTLPGGSTTTTLPGGSTTTTTVPGGSTTTTTLPDGSTTTTTLPDGPPPGPIILPPQP